MSIDPTLKQKNIIDSIAREHEGRFIIKACPGSGKTFTTAHLILKELEKWKSKSCGIAVLSFTNKAGDEVEEKISQIKGQRPRIGHPHFIGTFDTFFNNQVLFPFARGALQLPREPELVGEPHGVWRGYKSKGFYSIKPFESLHYTIDGEFAPLDTLSVGMRQQQYDNNKHAIHKVKRDINADGYMTQSDAIYFARKILEDNKYLARLLANRYPYIIIDEVQDSNTISMGIVDLLLESGVKKIVLIGDPNQAIYEWNDANPNAFLDKWSSWPEKFNLDNSHRSSDAICDFISCFSHGDIFHSSSDNSVKDFDVKPIVKSCDIGSVNNRPPNVLQDIWAVKEDFLNLCAQNNITVSTKTVAIVCRSKDDLALIRSGNDQAEAYANWSKCLKKQTNELCKAKYYYETSDFPRALSHWLNFQIYNSPEYDTLNKESILKYKIENGGAAKLMGLCVKELNKYTSIITGDLASWIELNYPDENKYSHLSGVFSHEVFEKFEVDTPVSGVPSYSTIHGVKGATFDALLVFLKSKGGRGSINYNTYIKDTSKQLKNNEDMRVAYVAISRPRKILMIAVPERFLNDWKEVFEDLLES